jgi:hypothetical protein
MLTVPGHVANGGHHGQHGLAEEALFARWATDHGHLHSGRP